MPRSRCRPSATPAAAGGTDLGLDPARLAPEADRLLRHGPQGHEGEIGALASDGSGSSGPRPEASPPGPRPGRGARGRGEQHEVDGGDERGGHARPDHVAAPGEQVNDEGAAEGRPVARPCPVTRPDEAARGPGQPDAHSNRPGDAEDDPWRQRSAGAGVRGRPGACACGLPFLVVAGGRWSAGVSDGGVGVVERPLVADEREGDRQAGPFAGLDQVLAAARVDGRRRTRPRARPRTATRSRSGSVELDHLADPVQLARAAGRPGP